MIRSIYHITLTFIILLSGMNYSFIQVHFHLNRVEIASAYCDNIEEPELECNGSCELDRRLSDSKERSEEGNNVFLEEFQFIYLVMAQLETLQKPYISSNIELNSHLLQLAISGIKSDFFHPPKRG
jgi:hypothetical protein